jgi:hypothetical protein
MVILNFFSVKWFFFTNQSVYCLVFVKKEFSEKKSFTMYFQNLSIYSQTVSNQQCHTSEAFLHAYMYNTQMSKLHSNFLTAQDSNNCETIPFGTTKYFNNTAGVKKSTSLMPGASNFHIWAS